MMEISFDPSKRQQTLLERGLDFADATKVFSAVTIDIPDQRRDNGEDRMMSIGLLDGRMVVIIWTDRGTSRRIISMRKANEREQLRYGQQLE